MAGKFLFRLLILLLLCVSDLICLNAVPITRIASLQHRFHGFEVSENSNMILSGITQENIEKNSLNLEIISKRRMEVELNDYPGSGANNRHTPKPQ